MEGTAYIVGRWWDLEEQMTSPLHVWKSDWKHQPIPGKGSSQDAD